MNTLASSPIKTPTPPPKSPEAIKPNAIHDFSGPAVAGLAASDLFLNRLLPTNAAMLQGFSNGLHTKLTTLTRRFFSGNIKQREFVLPTTKEARNFRTPLRGCDVGYFMLGDVPVALAYPQIQLDFAEMKKGLEFALDAIPIPAGRIIVSEEGVMEVSNVNSNGAILEFSKIDRCMPGEDASADAWLPYFEGIYKLESEPFNRPLLRARISHFSQGGSALCVCFSHAVADGESMVTFLQTWSDLVSGRVTREMLLKPEARVECDHRLPIDQQHRIKPENFTQQDRENGFLSNTELASFVAMLGKSFSMDEIADFVVSKTDYEAIKTSISQNLPKGTWVSAYEAFMGSLCKCIADMDGNRNFYGRVVVNLRGRSALVPQKYYGCGLSVHEFILPPSAVDSLANSSLALHDSLRSALQEPSQMEKVFLMSEMAQSQAVKHGVIERLRLLKVWSKCLLEKAPVLNSWIAMDWFAAGEFVPGQRPITMRVPSSFRFRRHVHLSPRSPNEIQLRMQLPQQEMKEFRNSLKKNGLLEWVKEVPVVPKSLAKM